MKVLYRGTPKSLQIWKGTCLACSSQMSETGGNLTIDNSHQIDGPIATADCPVCHVPFYMNPTSEFEKGEE